jgi:hypothetical protein
MTRDFVKLHHPRDEAETLLNDLAAPGWRPDSWSCASDGVRAALEMAATP